MVKKEGYYVYVVIDVDVDFHVHVADGHEAGDDDEDEKDKRRATNKSVGVSRVYDASIRTSRLSSTATNAIQGNAKKCNVMQSDAM